MSKFSALKDRSLKYFSAYKMNLMHYDNLQIQEICREDISPDLFEEDDENRFDNKKKLSNAFYTKWGYKENKPYKVDSFEY